MAVARARRTGVAFVVVVVVLAGLAIGAKTLWRSARDVVRGSGCDFGSYRTSLSRSENAATMVGVVISRKLPERAAVLALGAALQESKLDNIPDGQGDRDSVGILQQRPSQGWGPATDLADIRYATGKFLDALIKVPNWQTDSLATVIQRVQISADGSAYARHEAQAQQLADSLMGVQPAGVSCEFDKPTAVAPGAVVSAQLTKELPVNTPAVSGALVEVPGAAWATAAWLVTHANRYGIDRVSYAGRSWQRSSGWHSDPTVGSAGVRATLAG